MNKMNNLFYLIAFSSSLLTMSSNNWISMWMGLEMNLMAFTPLIINNKYKNSSTAAMTYFLIQSISSLILMFSLLMKINFYLFSDVMMISLLIKLGAAPFHMWVPEIMSKMTWSTCFMLTTWQKIAPLFMLMNLKSTSMIMNMSIIMSAIVGGIGGLNQTSLRKMLGFSSINHMSWMMLNYQMNVWMIYLMIYSLMMAMLCYLFYKMNVMFISQINSINMTSSEKLNISICMLSMGGLPPFIGFMPKWIVMQNMMAEKIFLIMAIMLMSSLITLLYYMRIMIKLMLMNSSSQKWMNMNSPLFLNPALLMINLSLPLMLIVNFK